MTADWWRWHAGEWAKIAVRWTGAACCYAGRLEWSKTKTCTQQALLCMAYMFDALAQAERSEMDRPRQDLEEMLGHFNTDDQKALLRLVAAIKAGTMDEAGFRAAVERLGIRPVVPFAEGN